MAKTVDGKKPCKQGLVIATESYLKIIPIYTDTIDFVSQTYVVGREAGLNFSPVCVIKGWNDQILVGSEAGIVSVIYYDPACGLYQIQKGSGPLFEDLPVIRQMAIACEFVSDELRWNIAAIGDGDKIMFYEYSLDTMSVSYKTKRVIPKAKIVSISNKLSSFLVFTDDGCVYNTDDMTPCNFFEDDADAATLGPCVAGTYKMGIIVMIFENGVVKLNACDGNCGIEKHTSFGRGLAVGMSPVVYDSWRMPYTYCDTFGDQTKWQHMCEPPEVYLLSSDGCCTGKFELSYEDMMNRVLNSEVLTAESEEDIVTAIMCASVAPHMERVFMHIVSEYMRTTNGCPVWNGFKCRINRLLNMINGQPILINIGEGTDLDDCYVVTEPFKKMPTKIVTQLGITKELIRSYIDREEMINKSASDKNFDDEKQKLEELENSIAKVVELIKLIGHISHQTIALMTDVTESASKSPASKDLCGLLANPVEFLVADDKCIVDVLSSDVIVDRVSTLMKIILRRAKPTRELDILSVEVVKQCPEIMDVAIQEMENARRKLSTCHSPTTARELCINAANVFIRQANHKYNTTSMTMDVCRELHRLGQTKLVLDVHASKVPVIDPDSKALEYLKDLNESSEDYFRKHRAFNIDFLNMFNTRDIDEFNEILATTKNEFLHYCIYQVIYEKLNDDFWHLDTDYIEEFISQDYYTILSRTDGTDRPYLWKYLVSHGKIIEAIECKDFQECSSKQKKFWYKRAYDLAVKTGNKEKMKQIRRKMNSP